MTVTKESWFGVCAEFVAQKCGVTGRKEDWRTMRSPLNSAFLRCACGGWIHPSHTFLFGEQGVLRMLSFLPLPPSQEWACLAQTSLQERACPGECMSGRPPASASLRLALPAHPVMESKVGTLGLRRFCPVQTPFTTGPCSAVLCWPEGEFSRLCCGPPFFVFF